MSEDHSFNFGISASEVADEAAEPIKSSPQRPAQPIRQAGKITSIDPDLVDIFPLNPRSERGFVAREDGELVASIKATGQTTPVIVRPSTVEGRYELIVGTRRLAAIREIRKGGDKRDLFAEILTLDDGAAWLRAETENAARKEISPLAQARSWLNGCTRFYDGNQAEMARALGVDKSVVSRALSLAELPDVLIDLVKNRDSINLHYAAQLGPVLKQADLGNKMLAHAKAMVEQGVRLSPAEAARRLLLNPDEADSAKPQFLGIGDHTRLGSWQVEAKGTVILKLKRLPSKVKPSDRKALIKLIVAKLDTHLQQD